MPVSRQSRCFTLALPLALFGTTVAVIAATVTGPVRALRFSHQSRATLLEIQRAVQDYHVAEEFYPKRTPLSGSELVAFLTASGHLKVAPLNPWTGQPYLPDEPAGQDGILYRTDELAETYSLESRGPDPTSPQPLWQLDSTEHQSLE